MLCAFTIIVSLPIKKSKLRRNFWKNKKSTVILHSRDSNCRCPWPRYTRNLDKLTLQTTQLSWSPTSTVLVSFVWYCCMIFLWMVKRGELVYFFQ
jgi:hypothetical protein